MVILGPTASGKSALAVEIAVAFEGEVVACDSTQVYRHFDIGTAKLRGAQTCSVAHHLINLLEPEVVFTAGDYQEHALAVLADLRRREKLPVMTAGTGLYLRALLEGLADVPTRSERLRERLRRRAESAGPERLHRILARLDREAAARIAPRDTPKLIRAIEVCLLAGKPISELHRTSLKAGLKGFHVIKVGLQPPRQALYARIDARVEAMLEQGWLEEVRELVARGVPATAKPFQFIGYSELREYSEGRRTRIDAVAAIQQATRRYAKRQITWFRRESGVHWFEGFGDAPDTSAAVRAYLIEQLSERRQRPTSARAESGV